MLGGISEAFRTSSIARAARSTRASAYRGPTTWSPAGTSWTRTHNISIDTSTGMCFPCGIRNSGTLVIDLTGNPTNPTLIGSYTSAYVHDLQVQNGYAHLAEIGSDRYRIMDWSNLPSMTSLSFRSVSSCHSAWPSRDDQYAVTTSEERNGRLTVFDISNKSSPTQIATWGTGSGASIHNAFIKDRVVNCSYYTEGYRAVDLSNPSSPVEVGFFDETNSTSTFSGNWGCYPFQPSGASKR